MQGKITEIDKSREEVMIDKKWYKLSRNLKIEWLKVDIDYDFKVDSAGIITFIKKDEGSSPGSTSSSSSNTSSDYAANQIMRIEFERQKQRIISRQAVINSSIRLSEINNEKLVTTDKIIDTAKIFEKFVYGEE